MSAMRTPCSPVRKRHTHTPRQTGPPPPAPAGRHSQEPWGKGRRGEGTRTHCHTLSPRLRPLIARSHTALFPVSGPCPPPRRSAAPCPPPYPLCPPHSVLPRALSAHYPGPLCLAQGPSSLPAPLPIPRPLPVPCAPRTAPGVPALTAPAAAHTCPARKPPRAHARASPAVAAPPASPLAAPSG